MAVHRREGGQVLILGVLGMTLVLVIGVIVVDFGLWFSGRASVLNAMDQASTAASLKLPTDGAGAEAVALQYAQDNDFDIAAGDVDVTFRCIVGDRNLNGQPDRGDILTVCPQLYGDPVPFICIGALCYHVCDYSAPNARCNTIVVQGEKTVEFGFAPIFGIAGAQAPGFVSAACRGACGGPPTLPLDLVMIIDRSSSMASGDLDSAKNGAEAILQLFDPAVQHVALGLLGPSDESTPCANGGWAVPSSSPTSGSWLPVGLSDDYQNPDGTLNLSSLLDRTIRCATDAFHSSSVGTDLGDPVKKATEYLMTEGRPGVKKGIILLTDGAANQPQTQNTGYLNCGANTPAAGGDGNGYETTASNACANGGGNASDATSGTTTNTPCTDGGKDRHDFYNYSIPPIPNGGTFSGIDVRLDGWIDSTSGASTRRMCVELSWDGGISWTAPQQTSSNLSTSENTFTLGSSTNNWGHSWTAAELSNAKFRVRVTDVANSTARTFRLDWAAVRVHYTFGLGPCDYANQQATGAKTVDPPIEVFTIGFGIASETCVDETSSSPYDNQDVTRLLADMATDSLDDGGDGPGGLSGGCDSATEIASENSDGDHFLCEAKGVDLEPLFRQAAEMLTGGSRLIKLPPSMLP